MLTLLAVLLGAGVVWLRAADEPKPAGQKPAAKTGAKKEGEAAEKPAGTAKPTSNKEEGGKKEAARKEGGGEAKPKAQAAARKDEQAEDDQGEKDDTIRQQRSAELSDESVRQAIERGTRYLWSKQKGDGSWPGQDKYVDGPAALAAYALLASGVSPLEPRMQKALDWLARQESTKTYCLGLRCNVWLLANKETQGKYSKQFREEVMKLITSTKDGSYNYDSRGDAKSSGDNSNSQFGVLGVWAGQMGLAEVPDQYWLQVLNHWRECQNHDGGWGYRKAGGKDKKAQAGGKDAQAASRATMTAAGLATLFVCFDALFSDKFVKCDVNTEFKPLRDGLEWMDKHYLGALKSGNRFHYFLYGVERVGLASGYKYFGAADWYRLGAERLLGQQQADGSWEGLVNTSFAILFLVRGQHPVAFNKLEFDGDWNNRPRDLAGLTRHLSGAFEKMLNWQIISMKAPVEEWHDAPILYITGAEEPKFTDKQLDKLRTYIWQGGTIFSVTACGGRGFSQGIRKVYEKLLPGYKLQQVPPTHALYTIQQRLGSRIPFHEIHNGIRPLVIHTDADLSRSWQLQMKQMDAQAFDAAANVLMYVTDKGQLRHRGVSHWPAAPRTQPKQTVKVARVKYAGRWDPEPLAFERFGRLLAREEKVALEMAAAVELAELPASGAKIAAMTGTEAVTLNAAEKAGLKAFIASGGTLIVDASGGSKAFAESMEAALDEAFGSRCVRRLSSMSPLYDLPGRKITTVSYRRRARVDRGLSNQPNLRAVTADGRLAVIFSTEDLTGGLIGCPSATCVGYAPDSSFDLMRNAILLAAGKGAPKVAAARSRED